MKQEGRYEIEVQIRDRGSDRDQVKGFYEVGRIGSPVGTAGPAGALPIETLPPGTFPTKEFPAKGIPTEALPLSAASPLLGSGLPARLVSGVAFLLPDLPNFNISFFRAPSLPSPPEPAVSRSLPEPA